MKPLGFPFPLGSTQETRQRSSRPSSCFSAGSQRHLSGCRPACSHSSRIARAFVPAPRFFVFAFAVFALLAASGCGELDTLREQTERQQQDLARSQSERDQYKKAYYEVVGIREKESREGEAARNALMREKNDILASLTLAREQHEAEKQRLSGQLAQQKAESDKTVKDLRDLIDSLKADLEDQRRQVETIRQESKTRQERIQELEGTATRITAERDETRREIETFRAQAKSADERAAVAEAKAAQLEEQLAESNAAIEEQKNLRNEAQRSLDGQKAEIERLEQELVRLKTEMLKTPVAPTPPPTVRRPGSLTPDSAKTLADELRGALSEAGVPKSEFEVVVNPSGAEGPSGPVVRLSTDWLFQEQSVLLGDAATRALARLGQSLGKSADLALRIEGHTDSLPVRNLPFPDNWGLASARADAVVRCLEGDGGIDGKRLTAVGRSRFNPLADNNTAEGRKKNRRVEIWVTATE